MIWQILTSSQCSCTELVILLILDGNLLELSNLGVEISFTLWSSNSFWLFGEGTSGMEDILHQFGSCTILSRYFLLRLYSKNYVTVRFSSPVCFEWEECGNIFMVMFVVFAPCLQQVWYCAFVWSCYVCVDCLIVVADLSSHAQRCIWLGM